MNNHDKLFTRICYTIVILFVILAICPFIYILIVSISDGSAIAAGNLFSSDNKLSFDSYVGLFKYANLNKSLLNSIFLSVIGTLLNMLFTIPCAYAISRKETKFKTIIYGILILAMFFRGEMIPSYVWMSKLGLLNTYWAIWLSKLVSIYNIFILSSFFEQIPHDVINAARLDGANEFKILYKIVLPMSLPAIVSISILYLASWWNDYYFTMIYIRDPNKFTLPLRIIQMVTNVEDSSVYNVADAAYAKLSVYGIRAAGIVISIIPMLFIIPIVQKHYIHGMKINKKERRK